MQTITTTPGLTTSERHFIKQVSSGLWMLKNATASAGIQSLIDRGYAKLSLVRCGPLALLTGDIAVSATEAGRAAIA